MFASGKHAKSNCDRCGFTYPYLEVKREAGTRIRVCPECNDGLYNRVDHPQNKPPMISRDPEGLRDSTGDREEVQGIYVYGETSNGFGVEYVGVFILTP